MYCYIKLMTALVVASILTKEVRSESTSFVKAHCFKVYNRYHNGCTGLRISTASDDDNIRDTCCHGNDTFGIEAAGYAHLSQPLGFPGYFMCDRCPEGKNKTIINHNHHQHQHHHHHQQQQQHHVKKYHHKHHNYKKWKKSLKPDFQSTMHVTRDDLKLADERERQMKQEKRKMKLTNKTKPDKISNSVILEETDEATRETTNMKTSTSSISRTTTTIQQQHETTTKSVATKSWPTTMTTTDVGMETTKNNHHHHHHHHNHHHHNRHKHHHHHHRKIANEADIPSTMVPTKSYATTVDHTDDWSKWSDWTPCFDTKRGCMQRRTRYCLLSSCPKSKGDDQEERICPDKIPMQSNCIKVVTRKNILVRRKDKHLLGTFRTTRKVTTLPKKISPAPTSSRSSPRMTTSNRTTTATTAGTNDNNNIEGVKHTRKALQRQKLVPPSQIKINSDKSKLELLSIFGKVNKIPERQYEWSAWQPCSVSCGVGVQVRKRICLIEHHHRSTKFSAKGNCSSDVVESKPCLVQSCSVNGNWSEWKVAVNCTSSPCSGEAGVMTWSRTCTNPSPSFGGKSCQGREWKREICYNNSGCSEKVDGGWCPWKNWIKSSKGSIRLRTCECPPPVNEGKHCQGPNEQTLNDAIFSTSNFHTTSITTKTQEYPFNECDESLGSGDGSDVSCDQEIIEKKSQLNSLSRPMKSRTNQDENYDDDDDDDDDVIGGSGDLK